MEDKFEAVKQRFRELSEELVNPAVMRDREKYARLNREYKELRQLIEKIDEYELTKARLEEARTVMREEDDKEMRELAKSEAAEAEDRLARLEEEIKFLMIPKAEEDRKNAIVEIRAGTGGDEASLFAGDLFRMYTRFAERKGWKVEMVDYNEGTAGGFKEVIFNVKGDDVYGTLKYEAGVHRVQRVPQTETQGRIHTSAATVMVLPEAEEFDVQIDMKDIRKDLFMSSGPGGQSVNTTYSAVRLTHIPTGIVAQCQDEKSQHKNFEKALRVLRSRIYEMELRKKKEEEAKLRRSMVSSGDRSAKIRTYNFPQGRVTDHRIGLTLYELDQVLDGRLDKLIDALKLADNTEKLKRAGEQWLK
ncbi:MAG: peptide chain release factor 1 [Chlorobi bacterium]|nr:peptide chain release factor 1 [Chlorobiota bacterium]